MWSGIVSNAPEKVAYFYNKGDMALKRRWLGQVERLGRWAFLLLAPVPFGNTVILQK